MINPEASSYPLTSDFVLAQTKPFRDRLIPFCSIFAACGEAGLPVLFHLDNERNTDKPGLPGLERVLQGNPKTNFIGHGPGWWASISGDVTQADIGGYPKGQTAPSGAIDRLRTPRRLGRRFRLS